MGVRAARVFIAGTHFGGIDLMDEIATTRLTIINDLGLHARAATLLVQTASRFESDLYISKDGRQINGKSIMGVLLLTAGKGTELEI